jgi:hypothetical protein
MKCTYCHLSIDEEDFGWGYRQEGYDRKPWHIECLQIYEDIAI